MKWLFICAHPDDLEYFVGPLMVHLSKKRKKRDEIIVGSLTRGEMSAFTRRTKSTMKAARIRTKELKESSHILGVDKLYFLGLVDGFVRVSRRSLDIFQKLLHEEMPDIVVAPEPIYTFYHHPDHTRAGRIAYSAIKELIEKKKLPKTPKVYYYGSLFNDFYFPIKKKYSSEIKAAVQAHRSQSALLIQSSVINLILQSIHGRFTPGYFKAIALREKKMNTSKQPDYEKRLGFLRKCIYYLGRSLNSERDYSDMKSFIDGTLKPTI